MTKLYGEIPGPEVDRYFYMVSHFAVRALGLATVLFRIEGAENIPQSGGAILASDHLHWSDTVFIPSAVPKRHVTVLGREGVMNPAFEHWGALSFHRPEPGEAMNIDDSRAIINVLAQDRLLHMYVPGTRKPNERPSDEIKRGAVFYARKSGKPIVPTIIKGSDNLAGQRVTVRFAPLMKEVATNKKEELELSRSLGKIIQDNFDDIDLGVFRRYSL